MYRFLVRPKWLAFTLLCAAAVVAMANLAVWQLGRLDERRQFNSLVEQRTAAPPVPIEELLGADPDDTAWRSVTATGTFEGPTEQTLTAGGYLLVTGFRLSGGQLVRVDRGFVGSAEQNVPPAPTGEVELVARIVRAPRSVRSVADGEIYLDLVTSTPPEPAVIPRALPTLTEGSHLSYAIQWSVFAVCVVVGWILAVRRSAHPSAGPSDDPSAPRRSKHQAVPWPEDDRARGARPEVHDPTR